jgi:hypothetical protein
MNNYEIITIPQPAKVVKSVSSWKRKFVGTISLDNFHFKDDVVKAYEKKTKKEFTADDCKTLVVYIKDTKIQFFNPHDNMLLLEFKFGGLTYDQDSFNISQDGLTLFSRDNDTIIVSTMSAKQGILPANSSYAKGYFNTIKYTLMNSRVSPQITIPMYNKFSFNKTSEMFALVYNGHMIDYDGTQRKLTKNGKTQLTIHNTFTGSVRKLIEIDALTVKQMAFSNNNTHIALVMQTTTGPVFMVYNIVTGEQVNSAQFKELDDVCQYEDNISWSPDDSKVIIRASKIVNEERVNSTILCFSNFLRGETISMGKINIDNDSTYVKTVNWNPTSDSICFNTHISFYTFNFETKVIQKQTLSDNLTDYISDVAFLANNMIVVTRNVKENQTFKDKTYKQGTTLSCPPDNEVPYIDIVFVN